MADAVIPGIRQNLNVDSAGAEVFGLVAASPNANSIGGRLKKLGRAASGGFETVAASQTAQVLGATGAAGDYIKRVVIIPETTAPGVVTLLDGATSIALWLGGTVGADLKPFHLDLDMISASGAWKITTGANVHVIGVGDFT